MADKIYNIPLRKEFRKVPKYKRANKAIRTIRTFLKKHVKQDDIKIGKYLNQKVLENGRKNVPHHVEVRVFTEEVGEKGKEEKVWKAELVGAPVEKVAEVKETKEEKTEKETKNEEKMENLNKESKELDVKKKTPKLKEGRLSTAPNKVEERKDMVSKSEKPSNETKLSKK